MTQNQVSESGAQESAKEEAQRTIKQHPSKIPLQLRLPFFNALRNHKPIEETSSSCLQGKQLAAAGGGWSPTANKQGGAMTDARARFRVAPRLRASVRQRFPGELRVPRRNSPAVRTLRSPSTEARHGIGVASQSRTWRVSRHGLLPEEMGEGQFGFCFSVCCVHTHESCVCFGRAQQCTAAIPFVVSRFLDSRRGRVTVLVVLVGGGAGLFKYWKAVKRSRKQAEREFVKEAGSMFLLCAQPR